MVNFQTLQQNQIVSMEIVTVVSNSQSPRCCRLCRALCKAENIIASIVECKNEAVDHLVNEMPFSATNIYQHPVLPLVNNCQSGSTVLWHSRDVSSSTCFVSAGTSTHMFVQALEQLWLDYDGIFRLYSLTSFQKHVFVITQKSIFSATYSTP